MEIKFKPNYFKPLLSLLEDEMLTLWFQKALQSDLLEQTKHVEVKEPEFRDA